MAGQGKEIVVNSDISIMSLLISVFSYKGDKMQFCLD